MTSTRIRFGTGKADPDSRFTVRTTEFGKEMVNKRSSFPWGTNLGFPRFGGQSSLGNVIRFRAGESEFVRGKNAETPTNNLMEAVRHAQRQRRH